MILVIWSFFIVYKKNAMHLPQTAEYALRAMVQMALLPPKRPVRALDLSKKTHVPLHFLSKIMRRLTAKGLLLSQRGCGGGFLLAKPLDQISFKDILSAANYHFQEKRCVFGWRQCHNEKPCPLHHAWSGIKTTFQQWAEETTLADVKKKRAITTFSSLK
ncbi:MAG: Rrf2 family transcriptional regulator [bacterium]|nr:Rrf2 family transcriptional regulator [bacterium]